MLSPENKKAVRSLFKNNKIYTFDEFEMAKALTLLESEGFLK